MPEGFLIARHNRLYYIETMEFARKLSYSFLYSTALVHVFCCGIPLVMSVVSISALLGMAGGDILALSWLEQHEALILLFSGVLLAITALLQYISYRIDCRTDGNCSHKPCDKEKRRARLVFYGATIIYAFSSIHFIIAHAS